MADASEFVEPSRRRAQLRAQVLAVEARARLAAANAEERLARARRCIADSNRRLDQQRQSEVVEQRIIIDDELRS